jgi:hypothetical protein
MDNSYRSRFRQRFGAQNVDPITGKPVADRKQFSGADDKVKDMYAQMQAELEEKQAALDQYDEENPSQNIGESLKRYLLQQVPLNMQASNLGTAQGNVDVPLAGGLNKLLPKDLAKMRGLSELAKSRGLQLADEVMQPAQKQAAQMQEVVKNPTNVALKEMRIQKEIENIQKYIRELEKIPGKEKELRQANTSLVKLKDALARKTFIGNDELDALARKTFIGNDKL